MTGFRQGRNIGPANRSKDAYKNYAAGLEIRRPGGALLLAPEIPSGCAIAAIAAHKCELVHNWRTTVFLGKKTKG